MMPAYKNVMNNLRLLFILVILLGLIATAQIGNRQRPSFQKTTLSPTPQSDQKAHKTQKQSLIVPSEDNLPSPTPSPLHTELIYPGSTLIKNTEQSFFLESEDTPDEITAWYKDTIESLGMNAKSAIQIQTNEDIQNKIVGANKDREVTIDITKKSDTKIVSIIITLTPS